MKRFQWISTLALVMVLGANWAAFAVEVNLLPPSESPYQNASGTLSVAYYGPYQGVGDNGKTYKYYTYYVTGVVTGLPVLTDPEDYYLLTGYVGSGPRGGGGSGAGVQTRAAVVVGIGRPFYVDSEGTATFAYDGSIRTSKFTSFEVWYWYYGPGYGTNLKVLSGTAK